MIFKGCTVVNGRGRAVVTATGMNTEMGKIAGLLNNSDQQKTPLQKRLNQLGKRISLLALGPQQLFSLLVNCKENRFLKCL